MRSELRAELLHRAEQDQAARDMREPDWETVDAVDADNLTWLKNVVAEVGWPGRSLAGEDGAHAAWLLAQHADSDPIFQRRCLDLITEAVNGGEASPAELAYLTDRVLLAEGQPQEYGTQMIGHKRGWVPRRLRDPEHVDERRAAMTLGPLREDISRIADDCGPPRPATMTCAECGGSIEVWPPGELGETANIRCAACGWTATLKVGTALKGATRLRMRLITQEHRSLGPGSGAGARCGDGQPADGSPLFNSRQDRRVVPGKSLRRAGPGPAGDLCDHPVLFRRALSN
ncbi:MAG: hypothetical protein JO287_09110 [Pseudonocardiales bacterium]|nr:hypothetical protein [Pseudonocardiales bacterium]